jgi:hypothetical protein
VGRLRTQQTCSWWAVQPQVPRRTGLKPRVCCWRQRRPRSGTGCRNCTPLKQERRMHTRTHAKTRTHMHIHMHTRKIHTHAQTSRTHARPQYSPMNMGGAEFTCQHAPAQHVAGGPRARLPVVPAGAQRQVTVTQTPRPGQVDVVANVPAHLRAVQQAGYAAQGGGLRAEQPVVAAVAAIGPCGTQHTHTRHPDAVTGEKGGSGCARGGGLAAGVHSEVRSQPPCAAARKDGSREEDPQHTCTCPTPALGTGWWGR